MSNSSTSSSSSSSSSSTILSPEEVAKLQHKNQLLLTQVEEFQLLLTQEKKLLCKFSSSEEDNANKKPRMIKSHLAWVKRKYPPRSFVKRGRYNCGSDDTPTVYCPKVPFCLPLSIPSSVVKLIPVSYDATNFIKVSKMSQGIIDIIHWHVDRAIDNFEGSLIKVGVSFTEQ